MCWTEISSEYTCLLELSLKHILRLSIVVSTTAEGRFLALTVDQALARCLKRRGNRADSLEDELLLSDEGDVLGSLLVSVDDGNSASCYSTIKTNTGCRERLCWL